VPLSDAVTVASVNENSPLTVDVNGLLEVERKGVEPSTSALRTHEACVTSESNKGLATSENPACTRACTNLDDLAKIVAAWPMLPEPVRQAMVALTAAAYR
jgi:hypothetical protein